MFKIPPTPSFDLPTIEQKTPQHDIPKPDFNFNGYAFVSGLVMPGSARKPKAPLPPPAPHKPEPEELLHQAKKIKPACLFPKEDGDHSDIPAIEWFQNLNQDQDSDIDFSESDT